MKTNYHTHHEYCSHAVGTTEDYVKEAIKQGFTMVGMSDHAPNKLLNDQHVRMSRSKYNDYLADINAIKERYKDQITVLKGVEVEYFPNHIPYYNEFIQQLDYLILGQHYVTLDGSMKDLRSSFSLKTPEELDAYATLIEMALETTKFDILAHPDLYMCGYLDFDEHAKITAKRIIKAAMKYNVPLEYNANGFRKKYNNTPQGYQPRYPREEFWDLVKEYGATVILSSDCHDPKFLYDDVVKQAENNIRQKNLNYIEEIPLQET